MQQNTLIAGTEPKKRGNLIGGQAMNITQGDNCPLPLRQLSQATLEQGTIFGSHDLFFGGARPGSRFT
jgi:hypothetical protein